MALRPIGIPDSIERAELSREVSQMIDVANERIEAFMRTDETVIENFVNCDFHLAARTLQWIASNHLLAGNRFCELGSGFGVVAMLAAEFGMESVGIEIEPALVRQSDALASRLGVAVEFFCGSFVPRNANVSHLVREMKHVETDEGDVYREIGLAIEDFDLLFAFPWPGEHELFETLLETCGSDGTLLLTYRGREGMELLRKN